MIADVKVPSNEWVSLNLLAGLPVGAELDFQNKSTSLVLVWVGPTKPNNTARSGKLLTGHKGAASYGSALQGSPEVWAICTTQGKEAALTVQSASGLSVGTAPTETHTTAEHATIAGKRFHSFVDTILANNETKYFLFSLPANATKFVDLQQRTFKTFTGAAEMQILWYSENSGLGVALPIFNENNVFEGVEVPQFQVHEIPAGNITDEGTVRERDFITGSGQGNNASGDVSPALGFRRYNKGTDFMFKLTNLHNGANRTIMGYAWAETDIIQQE